MKLTDIEVKQILELNSKFIKDVDIASSLQLPLKAIKACLKKSSITSRNVYNKQVNHDYFNTIDTPEKAYTLGLLAADGNINKHSLRLRLHPQDKELIEFVAKQLNWLKQPTVTKNGKDGKYKIMSLSIRSLRLVTDLINKYNFSYNKTYVNLFNNLGNLTKFFLLGLFDGDGSIFYSTFTRKSGEKMNKVEELYRFSYTGNTLTSSSIVEYLKAQDIELKNYTLKKNQNVSYIHSTKIQELLKLQSYLYDGHDLGLKRKRDMFKEAVEFYKKRDVQRL